jgi:hypothetical protein
MSSTHAGVRICLLTLALNVVAACSAEDPDVGRTDPFAGDPAGNMGDGDGDGDGDVTGAPMVELSFTGSAAEFANPERGFYVGHNLLTGDPDQVRNRGYSLAISLVRLDSYRDSALPQSLLDQLDAGLLRLRASGIKIILRFMYNSSFGEDAPKSRILQHIGQLQPLLQEYGDVIAVMQAGFIGAWGEWHSSTNGLDNPTDRRAILDALLGALPESRMVQVRTPMHVEGAYPGGPISPADAFGGSPRARLGHHNDCLLASSSDMGTYQSPVDQWRGYVADDSRFTPFGGETCALNAPRTDCSAALAELEMLHGTYVNSEYHGGVLDGWSSQGCEAEIGRRLGYRFTIESAAVSERVAPGGVLRVRVTVGNQGFAAPFNYRPVFVVLDDGVTRRTAKLASADPRRWAPGESITLEANLRIPADATPGSYRLSLRLPDQAPDLFDDARYAIRMANTGTWDEWTGDNLLTEALVIDPDAPGAVDPTAPDLSEM